MLEFAKHRRSFLLKDLKSCDVLSLMYGTESQIVMESSLSLFPAVRILFRASYENSALAIREGKLFQDMIVLSRFSSDLSILGGEQILWMQLNRALIQEIF